MSSIIPHARSMRDGFTAPSVPSQGRAMGAGTSAELEPEGGFFRAHGSQLVSQGYDIVPIRPGTKRPAGKGWQNRDYRTVDFRRAFRGHGVGVKTGRPNADGYAAVGADIDVKDTAAVATLMAWCNEKFGVAPVRVGNAPKVLLVFKARVSLRKMQSRAFRSTDGTVHRIEALGKGQQFVAHAIHPDTGRPYAWPEGDLTTFPMADLPEITEKQVYELFAFFADIVPDDWVPVTHESYPQRVERQHNTSKTPHAPAWQLRLALDAIPAHPSDPYDPWLKLGMALYHATQGHSEGLALWHEWSSKGNYDPHSLDSRWEGFSCVPGEHHLSAATLFRWADNADASWRDRVQAQERIEHEQTVQRLADKMASGDANAEDVGEDAGHLAPLNTFSLAEFAGKPIPRREWIVDGLIPDRNVTDLSGDGGTGKSLLALQLGIAVVTGGKWLGHATIGGCPPVLYVSAEDERDEIQRRAAPAAEREGLTLAELGSFNVVDLTCEPSTELALPDPVNRQSLKLTDLFIRLEAAVVALRPKLLILDTRADVYGGNEIDRVQVRTFIRGLQRLCRSYDMAILLLSHPSRAGLTTGDGQSGSTAWGNSVRSRLYLKQHSDDPDLRELSSEKANYGARGASILLRWRDGVLVVEGAVGGAAPDRAEQDRRVDARVLELLREFEAQGRHVNPSSGANYAPVQFVRADGLYSKQQYRSAIDRLFRAGRLRQVKAGRVSKIVEVEVDAGAKLHLLAKRQVSHAQG